MLEQKDFELLRKMMGEVMKENLDPVRDDVKELKTDVQSLKKMDHLILDEVVRVHEGVEAHISQLEKNMNEMKQYYRMDKLENDNMTLMLRFMNDLAKRIEELESKIA